MLATLFSFVIAVICELIRKRNARKVLGQTESFFKGMGGSMPIVALLVSSAYLRYPYPWGWQAICSAPFPPYLRLGFFNPVPRFCPLHWEQHEPPVHSPNGSTHTP